jgi:uncharacterized membrane protein YqjE
MADLERTTATAPAKSPEEQSDLEGLPALLGRLGDDVVTLLDTKLSLLKVEVKEDAEAYVRSGVMIAIGGVIAAVGFALLNVAVAFLVSTLFTFSEPVNYALGFIITGAAYILIGGIVVMVMKSRLTKVDPVPHRSVEELRKDKQWLKKEI